MLIKVVFRKSRVVEKRSEVRLVISGAGMGIIEDFEDFEDF